LKRLKSFAQARTAIVLDFDGTLAPIVQRQTQAIMSAKTRELVRAVAILYPTAVLSGRSLRDVSARVRGTRMRAVVGNHGLEWKNSARSKGLQKGVSFWKKEIRAAIRSRQLPCEGIEIEDKNLSLSIHYRQAPNPLRAKEAYLDFLKRYPRAHLIDGK